MTVNNSIIGPSYFDSNTALNYSYKSSSKPLSSASNSASYSEMGAGLLSLASGYASLQAASMEARQFKIQQIFDNLAAQNQKLKARENATFLRQKYLSSIASAKTSFAARNIDTGNGIANKYRIESLKNLGEDLQTRALNSDAIQNTLKLRISQSKLAENAARNIGILGASSSGYRGIDKITTGFSTLR